LLNVISTGGAGIADGETFTIRRIVSASPGGLANNVVIRATFEFNKDAFFVDANLDGIPDNTLINITSLNTAAQVVNLMQTQVASFRDTTTGLGLGIVPVAVSNSLLLDESSPDLILDTSAAPGLTVGFQVRTRDEIGAAFVEAFRSAPLTPALQPKYLGQGFVNPGTSSSHTLSAVGSNLLTLGTPGGPVDGQSFSISNAMTTVVYEFDQNGEATIGRVTVPVRYKYALQIPAGGSSDVREGDQFLVEVAGVAQVFEFNSDGILAFPGNLPIDITTPRTQDELTRSIVTTITNVFPAAQPRYLGSGKILLELDAAVVGNRVDTSGSVGLRHFFTDDVAQAVANVATPVGVRLSNLRDQGRIHVDGSPSHTVDLTSTTRLSFLGDLPKTLGVPAGLGFADGQRFTLSDGSQTVVFEFDSNGIVTEGHTPIDLLNLAFDANNDGTLLGQEAAELIVSAVNTSGLAIRAVAPADGQIFLQADDEDGVQFASGLIPGKMATVYVDSSSIGYVDAWVDLNQDGDWNDAGEQIFASQPVTAGTNTLSFLVPSNTTQGDTTARFRLSSLGGLRPTGLASDGEVEDHAIRVISNVGPSVTPGNGSIVLNPVNEDSVPITIALGPNGLNVFEDPDLTNGNGDRLQVRVVSVSNPSLLLATTSGMDLSLRFAPDQNGSAQIVVEAIDQAGEVARSTFSITVTPINDPPVSRGSASSNVVVNEDSAPVLVDMGTFFEDVDILTNNDRLSFSILSNDNAALVTPSLTGGTLRLQFGADRNGVARIAVQAQDLSGATAFSTVTVTVNAQNDAPRAVDDVVATTEDQRITAFNVLTNDSDPDAGDLLTVIQVAGSNTLAGTSQLGASVSINANGVLNYDPTSSATIQALAQNATAQDRFTYQVRDNGGLTGTATVTINLTGINDAPVALDDSPQVDKNTTVAISVTANDSDPEGSTLLVTQVNNVVVNQGQTLTLPSGARVTRNANNVLTYNPNGVYNGLTAGQTAVDTFTYTVIDTLGAAATASVRVTVRGPNTPPVAENDLRTTDEQTSIAINVLSNDTDADGHVLSLQSFDVAGTIGIVTRVGNQLVYNPNGRFESLGVGETATDRFRYTVVDTEGGTAVGTVTVTINGVNDAPIAVNDGYIAFRGQSFSTTDPTGSTTPTNQQDDGLLANDSDIDGDPLTISVLVQPRYGTLTMNANGTFTYVNNGNSAVVDTFTYELSDGQGGSASASVTITVQATPPSPWQNPSNRFDVNADGFVAPIDALVLINRINAIGPGPLSVPAVPPNAPPPYLDVNGDRQLSANDVLQTVNFLNNRAAMGGEGEGEGEAATSSIQVLALGSEFYGWALWQQLHHSLLAEATSGSESEPKEAVEPAAAVLASADENLFANLNANDADAAWLPSPVQVDREERLTSPAEFVDAVDEIFGNPFGWNSRS
jgi:VCBS repeat-containing protein